MRVLFLFLCLGLCPPTLVAQELHIAYAYGVPDHLLGAQLLREIYSKAGLKLIMVARPNKRALLESNHGILDGELQRIAGLESFYPNLVPVPTSFNFAEIVAFTKNNRRFSIQSYRSLEGKRVGTVRGMKFAERGLAGNPTVIEANDEEQLFSMLMVDRIDVLITEKFSGNYLIAKYNYQNIGYLEPVIERLELFHYVHMSNQKHIAALNKATIELAKDHGLINMRDIYAKEMIAQENKNANLRTLQENLIK